MVQALLGCSHPAWRPGGSGSLASQRAVASKGAVILVAAYFAALMIGDRPFAPDGVDKAPLVASGNSFNRLVILGSLGAGGLLLLLFLERSFRLALRNWPIVALVVWSALSVIWADHPDLVLRRAFAFAAVVVVLVALAASLRAPNDFLPPLAAVFGLVTALNVVAMTVFPEASRSPIGETGIFDNKNSAGTMAMLAIVVLAAIVPVAGTRALRLGYLALLALAWLFLLATRSKTSIGVAGLMTVLGPALYLLLGRSAPARVATYAAALGASALALTVYAGLGYDDRDLRLLLFGDLTFTGRTEIWEHVTLEIGRQPLLGYGFGSFWDTGALVNPLRSAPADAWFLNAQLINTAHNGYLDVLLQTGAVGLTLSLVAVGQCCRRLLAAAVDAPPRDRIAPIAALCVVLCIVLNNLLESYLFRTGDTIGYLFIFLALVAGRMGAERALAPRPARLDRP